MSLRVPINLVYSTVLEVPLGQEILNFGMLFQVLKFKISLESEYIKFEESTEFGGGVIQIWGFYWIWAIFQLGGFLKCWGLLQTIQGRGSLKSENPTEVRHLS